MARLPSIPLLPTMMQQPVRPVQTVAGMLSNLPPSIVKAPQGTRIEGTISQLTSGRATLQTPLGKMNIQTSLPLYVGERLNLEILKTGRHMQVRLVAIDGEPVSRQASEKKGASGNERLTQAAQKMLEQTILFVHHPSSKASKPDTLDEHNPAVILGSDKGQLRGGETVKSMLLQVQMHGLEQWLSKLAKTGFNLELLLPGFLKEEFEKQKRSVTPKLFSDGTKALCRVWHIHMPDSKTLSPLSQEERQSGRFLEAKIIGIERSGQLVARTPIGTLSLPSIVALPKGTSLWLEPVMLTPPLMEASAEIATSFFSPTYQMLQHWQHAVKEIGLLRAEGKIPEGTRYLFPTMSKTLLNELYEFWSSIASGNIAQMIPRATAQALKRSDQGWLLDAIEADFQDMHERLNAPDDEGWVHMVFPILDPPTLHYGRFTYKKQSFREEEQTHFLIEWESSLTGVLLCDGFVKRPHAREEQNGGRGQCDLVLRTARALPSEMEGEITAIYKHIMEAALMKGSIRFQPHIANQAPPFDAEGGCSVTA